MPMVKAPPWRADREVDEQDALERENELAAGVEPGGDPAELIWALTASALSCCQRALAIALLAERLDRRDAAHQFDEGCYSPSRRW